MVLYEKSFLSDRKAKTILSQLEGAQKAGKEIKIQTFTRRFINSFSCIDTPEKPFILYNFWVSGELIYTKAGFNYKTIGFDNILKIEIN